MKKNKISLQILVILSSIFLISANPIQAALPTEAYISGLVGHAQSYALSCESRSAADLANYWGITVSETEFLNALPESDDPEKGFVGNVNNPWGNIPPQAYGVHAKPVADLLNTYGLDAQAHKALLFTDLQAEIATGRPVIVWVIGGVWAGTPQTYTANDGSQTIVAKFEHTMIMIGYDTNNVYLVDAGSGYTQTHTIANFKDSWSVLGNMAVTARATNEEPPASPTYEGDTYIVKQGDYLSGLAEQFNISWQDLAAINDISYPYIIIPGQVLKTGQSIDAEDTPATDTPAENTPLPQPTATPTQDEAQDPGDDYTVLQGEHLMQIARKLKLDWVAIAETNNLASPYTLYPGQVLKLPGSKTELSPTNTPEPQPTATIDPEITPEPTSTPTPSEVVDTGNTYTVLSGDHLMQIARKLQLNWVAIAELNNLTSPYTLSPGQVLKLPGPEAGSPPPPLLEDSSTSETPSSDTDEDIGKTYTVQTGEYIVSIARKLGINWLTLAAVNNLTYPYIVQPGRVLTLP